MKIYVGLDVGIEETSLFIVDSEGVTVREVKVSTEPEAIRCALDGYADRGKRIVTALGTKRRGCGTPRAASRSASRSRAIRRVCGTRRSAPTASASSPRWGPNGAAVENFPRRHRGNCGSCQGCFAPLSDRRANNALPKSISCLMRQKMPSGCFPRMDEEMRFCAFGSERYAPDQAQAR
jgi:hypothetical protein